MPLPRAGFSRFVTARYPTPAMQVECPRCRRPNAPHRATCLYCGATMPTPTVAPPPKERVLPANFDELVRRAMSGSGGVGELRKALQAKPAPAAAVAPAEAETRAAEAEDPEAAAVADVLPVGY